MGFYFRNKNTKDMGIAEKPQATEEAAVDETEGWKVYRNTVLGFSVKYPSSLNVSGSTTDAEVGIVKFKDNEGKDEYKVLKNVPRGWIAKNYSEESVIVDGIEGTVTLWLWCGSTSNESDLMDCVENLNLSNFFTARVSEIFLIGNDTWLVW